MSSINTDFIVSPINISSSELNSISPTFGVSAIASTLSNSDSSVYSLRTHYSCSGRTDDVFGVDANNINLEYTIDNGQILEIEMEYFIMNN